MFKKILGETPARTGHLLIFTRSKQLKRRCLN